MNEKEMFMKRIVYLFIVVFLLPVGTLSARGKKEAVKTDREVWCDVLYRMASPVLSAMSEGKLQEKMSVELSPTWDGRDRRVTYMECFGRLMDDWLRGFLCPMTIRKKENNAGN